ncbi:hypothetical protein [Cesiribacter sp. SM1]|uniref:hypothetical protein n=1 Tax=Cesiribacter sp. SM1 TaxID=2861196 RepID=UPI001CD374BD|nr:hypothetical protein [Cesiribacter sp. SM1]
MKNPSSVPVYAEKQNLKISAVRFIMGFATVISLAPFFWKLYSSGWAQQDLLAALPVLLILGGVWWVVESSRIHTRITAEGICYWFYPLQFRRRFARWEELKEVYMQEYNALADYGGWGLRWGIKGWGYVAPGNIGIQLVYKSGKKRFISTQRPNELRTWLEQYAPASIIGAESR